MKKLKIEGIHLQLSQEKNNTYFLGVISFIVTAFFSVGFLHPDEHYQILELLNLKLPGKVIDRSIFNWDLNLYIRSWFQTFIYYLLIKPLSFLNGFQISFLTRLFNGLFGFWGIIYFFKSIGSFEEKTKKVLMMSMIWFVPFLMVRTNSESLSLSFFFFGYYFYNKEKKINAIFLWSLSFLTRYQMALLVAPIILIDLLKKDLKIKSASMMFLILIVGLSIGVLIDFWGYEKWVWAPYNYFYQNLVLNKSANFGVEPFYYYLVKPLIKGVPPLSLFVLFFSSKYMWKNRRSSLIYALLTFLLVHSYIPHKEVRFLIPVYIILTIFAVEEFVNKNKFTKMYMALFILNIFIMMKTSLTPAHSRINLYKYAYKKNFTKVFVPNAEKKFEFTMPFYMNRKIETEFLKNLGLEKSYVLFTSNLKEYKLFENKSACDLKYSQYPKWLQKFNFFNWLSRSSYFAFWSCKA